jgi:hypothetical protein
LTDQVTARLVAEPTAARVLFCPRVIAIRQRDPNARCPVFVNAGTAWYDRLTGREPPLSCWHD